MVATFNKQSHIKYAAAEINTTLLHVAVRFYPFDMSGIILRRFFDDCEDCDNVELNLTDGRLFLTAVLNGCDVTLPSPSSTVNVRNNRYTIKKQRLRIRKKICNIIERRMKNILKICVQIETSSV